MYQITVIMVQLVFFISISSLLHCSKQMPPEVNFKTDASKNPPKTTSLNHADIQLEVPYGELLDEGPERFRDAVHSEDVKSALLSFAQWLEGLEDVESAYVCQKGLDVMVRLTTGHVFAFGYAPRLESVTTSVEKKRTISAVPDDLSATNPVRFTTIGKTGVFTGIGEGFTHFVDRIGDGLSEVGFNVEPNKKLTVDQLAHIDGYDVLLLHSHGMDPSKDEVSEWAITTCDTGVYDPETSDWVAPQGYEADYNSGKIFIKCMLYERQVDEHHWEEVYQYLWCATGQFISDHNGQMPENSIVALMVCHSWQALDIFLDDLKASACLGWSNVIDPNFAAEAACYFFECLLMKEHQGPFYLSLLPAEPFTFKPPMRPLTVSEAITVLQKQGLNKDTYQNYSQWNASSAPELLWGTMPTNVDVTMRPAITAGARFENDLELRGHFGNTLGEVTLANIVMGVNSWQSNKIKLVWPVPEISGKVKVKASNGMTSNEALFTEYTSAVAIQVSHPMYSGIVTLSGNDFNIAGGFLNPNTLDIYPVNRGLLFTDDDMISWNFTGEDGSSIGSQELGSMSFCYSLSDEKVDMHNNVIIIFQLPNDEPALQTQSCFLSTASIPTTSPYDPETGIIGSGNCNWTTISPFGNQQNVMSIGMMSPSPSVDLSDPR